MKELLTPEPRQAERLADALIERETLDAEEIAAVLEGRELPKREKVIIPTYAEKDKASKEKRRVASIFGGPPKPATSGSLTHQRLGVSRNSLPAEPRRRI